MQFPLTPEQLVKLVELAYLGEWVVNSRHGEDLQDESARDTFQALLGASALAGVERDPETGGYYLNADWQDGVQQILLDYEDHVFWDELVERLALRDLARQMSVQMEDLERDDYLAQLRPLEERYRRELEEDGVERLGINRGFSP